MYAVGKWNDMNEMNPEKNHMVIRLNKNKYTGSNLLTMMGSTLAIIVYNEKYFLNSSSSSYIMLSIEQQQVHARQTLEPRRCIHACIEAERKCKLNYTLFLNLVENLPLKYNVVSRFSLCGQN